MNPITAAFALIRAKKLLRRCAKCGHRQVVVVEPGKTPRCSRCGAAFDTRPRPAG